MTAPEFVMMILPSICILVGYVTGSLVTMAIIYFRKD